VTAACNNGCSEQGCGVLWLSVSDVVQAFSLITVGTAFTKYDMLLINKAANPAHTPVSTAVFTALTHSLLSLTNHQQCVKCCSQPEGEEQTSRTLTENNSCRSAAAAENNSSGCYMHHHHHHHVTNQAIASMLHAPAIFQWWPTVDMRHSF
jgi:hypothetical protein